MWRGENNYIPTPARGNDAKAVINSNLRKSIESDPIDFDWVLLSRATVSPFLDNRPLLQTGKPELRRYTAVFMLKDQEIGQYSDDLVINCAP